MAVEYVRQRRQRQWGAERFGRRGSRLYLVKCDDINDGPEVAAAAAGIPRGGDIWSTAQPALKAVSIDAEEVGEDGFLFAVSVQYATDEIGDLQQPEDHPLDRAPFVSLRFERFRETVTRCEEIPTGERDGARYAIQWTWGKTVCNSAGMSFDPSVDKTFSDPVFTIVRNEANADFGKVVDLVDAVNKDDFIIRHRNKTYTIREGQAYMADVLSSPQVEVFDDAKIEYDQVTYEVAVRQDGWKRKIRDEGLYELGTAFEIPGRPIRDVNGNPVTRSHLLDGKGKKLVGTSVKPVFLVFDLEKKRSFAPLGFQIAKGVR